MIAGSKMFFFFVGFFLTVLDVISRFQGNVENLLGSNIQCVFLCYNGAKADYGPHILISGRVSTLSNSKSQLTRNAETFLVCVSFAI